MSQDLKEIRQDLTDIKVTLATNTAHLEEHMRRTDILEKKVDSLWAKALSIVSLLGGILALIKMAL